MIEPTNRQTYRQINRQKNGRIHRQTARQTDNGRIDRYMEIWKKDQIDSIDRWMN